VKTHESSHVDRLGAVIGRLVGRGHLQLAPQSEGRGRYYVLREVLLRYWHQWRANQRQLSLFVDFLAAWFQCEELEELKQAQAQAARVDQEWDSAIAAAIDTQSLVHDRLAMNQHFDRQDVALSCKGRGFWKARLLLSADSLL
jgi:hypothetical protein